METLLLHCVSDIHVDWNPRPGIQSTTTFKYREGHICLDIKQKGTSSTITCPCCGRRVEFQVYPGLKFFDALKLWWKDERILFLILLFAGIVLSIIIPPIGVLVLLSIPLELIRNGPHKNRKLQIVDSSGHHHLFLGKKVISTTVGMGRYLQKRQAYYDKRKA
jgi:hypothetical protein